MEKAVKMGKDSATGSLQLFIGKIGSTLMLALGSIIVGIFISPGEYGLYTIALVPAATFLLFQDWGVGTALTKYCANYRAEKKEDELWNVIVTGLTFEAITGLSLTLLSLFTANLIASAIYSSPGSGILIALASVSILSSAVYGGSLSVFMGFERMDLSTITMIISATIQGLLTPLLVYLGFGALGAVAGYTVASISSGIIGLILLYFVILKKLPSRSTSKATMIQTLKPLIRYGIPVAGAIILGGIATQISNFVMASSTDIALIGNYKIAINFAALLALFIYPIQTVLFPAFSKLDPSKDKQLLKTVYSSSVKYSSLFIAPATIALMVLSGPLISTIYGDKWPFAPFYLTLYVIGNLLVLLGGLVYGKLFYATGETQFIMKLNALILCIEAPLAFILIPPLGIIGVIIASFIVGIVSSVVGIYWTWKRYETKPDLRNSGRMLLASVIAGATTYLFQTIFPVAAWIELTLGIMLFLGVFFICAPLIGAINQTDVANLRAMFSGLGPLSKLLKTFLVLIEKPLRIKEKLSRTGEQK